jgi:hypothetical protein
VTITNSGGYTMVFTLDGSTPTISSPIYTGPISLPLGGTVQAACLSAQGQLGLVASASFAGLAPIGWSVVAVDSQDPSYPAINAIDSNYSTFWMTRSNADLVLPHYITVDLGAQHWLGGFNYLPRQDGGQNGTVYQYRFDTSADGVAWITNATGNFANIAVNPSRQDVQFSPVEVRYFRFTALQEVNTNGWTSAAEISVVPAGFDAWRSNLGLQSNGPLSDPGGNGVPLLMEYYEGLTPSSTARLPLAIEGATNGGFQFSVRHQPGLVDVTGTCLVSTNLQSWVPAVGVVTNGVTANPDGTETLHLSMPKPIGNQVLFLRLLVSPQ